MKKNILAITLISLVISTTSSFAQKKEKEKNNSNDQLSSRKSEVISNLNQRKSVIDKAISCVNSASSEDALKACREAEKESMKKIKEEMKAKHKEHLQNKLKELDEKDND